MSQDHNAFSINLVFLNEVLGILCTDNFSSGKRDIKLS